MNHDNAHCLDFSERCPKSCFRAQLSRDLKDRTDLFGIPLTYQHFEDCRYAKKEGGRKHDD